MNDIMKSMNDEVCLERFMGNVDVERLDGTLEHNIEMYRKEKLADEDDTESVYEVEYVAMSDGEIQEEIFLGDDKGNTMIIKERSL